MYIYISGVPLYGELLFSFFIRKNCGHLDTPTAKNSVFIEKNGHLDTSHSISDTLRYRMQYVSAILP